MILSVLGMRYWIFRLSNQRKHTNSNHLCFQNTFYKLNVSGFHGNGGDALTGGSIPNNGMAFSTYDQDHDTWSNNCANKYGGGWWWKGCGNVNLNGFNHGHGKTTHSSATSQSMSWWYFGDSSESLKTISMAIRPLRL